MNVWLTGAGGHIGSKILGELERLAIPVTTLGVTNKWPNRTAHFSLSSSFRNTTVNTDDVLALCGAQYFKGNNREVIRQMVEYNVGHTGRLVDSFQRAGGNKIVFFSSYMQLYDRSVVQYAHDYLDTKQVILERIQTSTSLLNIFIYDNWSVDDHRPKFAHVFLKHMKANKELFIPRKETLIDLCDSTELASKIVYLLLNWREGSLSLATGAPITLEELVESTPLNRSQRGLIRYGGQLPTTAFIPYIDVERISPARLILEG